MGDCFAPLGPPLLPWDLMAQTHRHTYLHTDGHGDSWTDSAQWGRDGERVCKLPAPHREDIPKCLYFLGGNLDFWPIPIPKNFQYNIDN